MSPPQQEVVLLRPRGGRRASTFFQHLIWLIRVSSMLCQWISWVYSSHQPEERLCIMRFLCILRSVTAHLKQVCSRRYALRDTERGEEKVQVVHVGGGRPDTAGRLPGGAEEDTQCSASERPGQT